MKKKREDAESVDNDSTMSTSSNLEPFANDDLGIVMHAETVDFGKQGAEACKTVHLFETFSTSEILCLMPLIILRYPLPTSPSRNTLGLL